MKLDCVESSSLIPPCPDRPKTQCEHHRDSAQDGFSLVGALIPECDEEGRYRPLQCHGSTGHCWCVSDQGQERAGTRTPPGSPRPNCDEQGESVLKHGSEKEFCS